jgi:hypothetical protein
MGRDGIFFTAAYNGSYGNPAGSFEGSFAAQTVFSPEVDAIRITASPLFQNYTAVYGPTYTTFNWTFDFIAQDIAPSTFNIYFGNATDTFLYTISLSPVLGLNSLTINLASSAWSGGPGTYSTYDFSSMTYIDIQYSRNGSGSQLYFLDNFALNGFSGSGGGGGEESAIPEPNTWLLMTFVGALMVSLRRRFSRALPH